VKIKDSLHSSQNQGQQSSNKIVMSEVQSVISPKDNISTSKILGILGIVGAVVITSVVVVKKRLNKKVKK
jgi:hypothetical protein